MGCYWGDKEKLTAPALEHACVCRQRIWSSIRRQQQSQMHACVCRQGRIMGLILNHVYLTIAFDPGIKRIFNVYINTLTPGNTVHNLSLP